MTNNVNERKTKPFESFVIGRRPMCVWDSDLPQININFVNELDPNYFSSLADFYWKILESESGEHNKKVHQHAAVALRTAYSQSLEVLFSLLFASVQAPRCVFGWLSGYTNKDLIELVNEIRAGKEILTRFEGSFSSWESLAELIHYPLKQSRPDVAQDVIDNFTILWTRFAQDFANELFTKEYNSIKHGLRVRMGGFYAGISQQPDKETLAPNEEMMTLASSEFGATFYNHERINKTPNYLIHRVSRNWFPENYRNGLHLISTSISNVIAFVKITVDSTGGGVGYYWDERPFHNKPWAVGSNPSLTQHSRIIVENIPLHTPEEILESYEPEKK